MDKSKADKITLKLMAIADGLKFGSVSVTVKFYGGQIVTVSYAKTEQTLEQIKKKDERSEE